MTIPDFSAANISPELVTKIKKLEQDLRNETKQNIVLIAYQEQEQNEDTHYVFPYWE